MPLGMEVGLSPVDFVLDENPAPSPKRKRSPPILGPCLLRLNGCMDQDASWYGGRPRPRRHCVRWGPSSPFPKKWAEPPPQLSAYVYCGQTAGWIKEVGFGPGHIVLGWDPVPLPRKKEGRSSNLRPNFIVAKRLHGSRCHFVWR